MLTIPEKLVIFDGFCNLCNRSVQFIIRRDHNNKFRFVSSQSKRGQEILSGLNLSETDRSTVVYLRNEIPLVRSSAVLHILKDLGGFWALLYSLIAIPPVIRDRLYDVIARKRYGWFGRMDQCMVPSGKDSELFLD